MSKTSAPDVRHITDKLFRAERETAAALFALCAARAGSRDDAERPPASYVILEPNEHGDASHNVQLAVALACATELKWRVLLLVDKLADSSREILTRLASKLTPGVEISFEPPTKWEDTAALEGPVIAWSLQSFKTARLSGPPLNVFDLVVTHESYLGGGEDAYKSALACFNRAEALLVWAAKEGPLWQKESLVHQDRAAAVYEAPRVFELPRKRPATLPPLDTLKIATVSAVVPLGRGANEDASRFAPGMYVLVPENFPASVQLTVGHTGRTWATATVGDVLTHFVAFPAPTVREADERYGEALAAGETPQHLVLVKGQADPELTIISDERGYGTSLYFSPRLMGKEMRGPYPEGILEWEEPPALLEEIVGRTRTRGPGPADVARKPDHAHRLVPAAVSRAAEERGYVYRGHVAAVGDCHASWRRHVREYREGGVNLVVRLKVVTKFGGVGTDSLSIVRYEVEEEIYYQANSIMKHSSVISPEEVAARLAEAEDRVTREAEARGV